MPRTPSSPADRPKWLRFEAGDEESHELFAPGANWRKQDQLELELELTHFRGRVLV